MGRLTRPYPTSEGPPRLPMPILQTRGLTKRFGGLLAVNNVDLTVEKGEIKVGDTHTERVVENLSRTQLVMYAGASGDYNPLHSDELYTTTVAGYPSVFAHGMLTMGLTGKMLTNYVGAGRVRKFGVRFTNQVWPGDTLDSTATITGIKDENGQKLVDLDVVTVNQDGKEVVRGTAEASIDP